MNSAQFTGAMAVPGSGERRPVDEQAGAVARVLLPASCQEQLQEGGHLLAAVQELVEDDEQVGEVGHRVAGQPGLAGGPRGRRDRRRGDEMPVSA
jgi:hypothetical protein